MILFSTSLIFFELQSMLNPCFDQPYSCLGIFFSVVMFHCRAGDITAKSADNSEPDINELSFTEIRDKLLALDPLNKDHIIKVNKAEAEFWSNSEGYRVGWSDDILGFDCGGQQWVSETCFPAGTLAKPTMRDLEYIEELKKLIEKEAVPAPAPIEQRWSARSKSPMSPASSPQEDIIFSWVNNVVIPLILIPILIGCFICRCQL